MTRDLRTQRVAAAADARRAGNGWAAVPALATAAIALALAGCGKSEAPAAPSATPAPAAAAAARPQAKAAPSPNASAEEVAKEARGDVSCPAKSALAPRKDGAPVDDVVGVRPGMSWDEAANAVMCSNPLLVVREERGRGFQMQTYGQKIRQGFTARIAEPRVAKTGKQIMQEMQRDAMARGMNARVEDLQPGQVKWFVGTMGTPGDERVLSAAREERSAAGQAPTIDAVAQAMVAKYGEPTRRRADADGTTHLTWAYDPLGRRVPEASPLYGKCIGTPDPDGGVNLTPDCGIVVAAQLRASRDNKALVEYMMVGVVDESGGYKRISDTEQALQKGDQERRAAEVDQAKRNAKGPTL